MMKAARQQFKNSRPISNSSVLTRLPRKALVHRIDGWIQMDEQQRALRVAIDGCEANIDLLGGILRRQCNRHKPLYVVTDMTRTLDSVQHSVFAAAIQACGLPSELVKYLRRLYGSSYTQLPGDTLHIGAARGRSREIRSFR